MSRRSHGPQLDSEVPEAFIQTGAPVKKIRQRRARVRVFIDALIVMFLFATVANVVMVVQNYRSANMLWATVTEDSSPSFRSRYDILGAQVVESWLTGAEPIIDMAAGVSWPASGAGVSTGIDVVSVGYLGGETVNVDGGSGYHEVLSYVVVADDGTQYTASIDMGIVPDPDTGAVSPVLLSAPFVEARDSVQVISGTGQPGWSVFTVESGSPLARQTEVWTEAWTANNSETLKNLSGDTSSSTYVGMNATEQWEQVPGSSTIVWSVAHPEGDSTVVVRVMWDITTVAPEEGTPEADPESERYRPVKTMRQSADLLVADAGTGLPKIVAWGPPGSYADLEAYQNAVEDEG